MTLTPRSAPPAMAHPGTRPARTASARPPAPSAAEVGDTVSLTGSERALLAVGLGLSALGAFGALPAAPPPAPAHALPARTDSRTASYERLQSLAFGRGAEAPRGEALRWLEHYARTDYGAEMLDKVLADFDEAAGKGWVDAEGRLTLDGHFEGYVPFRILHSEGSAEGSFAEIRLPERFGERFRYSGQEVDPPAILHHEFGHTRYGHPAGPDDLRHTPGGTRLRLDHEMQIVDEYENPVRVRDGFEPRYRYYDETGENFACSAVYGCGPAVGR